MKTIITLMAIGFYAAAVAQSNIEDVDLIQSIYGKEKKMIVGNFVRLEGFQEDVFWSLYDEYEVKRKELGKRRVAILEKYVATYESMDDATTIKIINETADLGARTDKLITTYFRKIEKSVGAKPAAQFFQLEEYLLSVVRLKIFENMPLIGEKD